MRVKCSWGRATWHAYLAALFCIVKDPAVPQSWTVPMAEHAETIVNMAGWGTERGAWARLHQLFWELFYSSEHIILLGLKHCSSSHWDDHVLICTWWRWSGMCFYCVQHNPLRNNTSGEQLMLYSVQHWHLIQSWKYLFLNPPDGKVCAAVHI